MEHKVTMPRGARSPHLGISKVLQERFRCEICGMSVPPRTRLQRLVTDTRDKRYPARAAANRVVEQAGGKRRVVWKDDPGGVGSEIAREVPVCPTCASK